MSKLSNTSKRMLINSAEGHECRIAMIQKGRLEELYTERASSLSNVGSIYKGRVTNVEPSIQAAFVDFGGTKNGFLHISDVHPRFFPKNKKNTEQVGRRTAHRTRPPIQECLRRGQEIVVQMTKQGIGTKGPTMTTYLSIPGRLIVMMPDMTHVGISRKIEDEEARGKLRAVLDQLEVPKDLGVIVRTAGVDRPKRELQRDLSYLTRLWKAVQERIATSKAPAEIYQESDLVIRTIRDVFDSDVERIICDQPDVGEKVQEFLDVAVPRAKCAIELYVGRRGLFEEFGVEEEIRKVHARLVELDNGGSLVFDQAEALVAIDVNSGSFRAHANAEANALQLNLTAAEEIGRQLRLRDMGGVIIIDFVDLREEKHRRQLERKMRDVLKLDRAKSKLLRISNFGILEMTRQRLRPSLKQSIFTHCPHCDGTGLVMSRESAALAVMRNLQVACANETVSTIEVSVAPSVAHHLSNTQRQTITDLETRSGKTIIITADAEVSENDVRVRCTNLRGANVAWELPPRDANQTDEAEIVDIRAFLRDRVSGTSSVAAEPAATDEPKGTPGETETKPRRRGKRGGRQRKKPSETTPPADTAESKAAPPAPADTPFEEPPAQSKRRRRKRTPKTTPTMSETQKKTPETPPSSSDAKTEPAKPKSRRRGKRGGRKHKKKTAAGASPATPPEETT